MGHSVTIGGERLGSGKKNKAYLHHYERSNHDVSYVWRSTMASGPLVPFMTEVALPGDTFDLYLDADCLTHPTTGPLFGSYKIQLDVFQIPMRIYQPKLHMNMLGIGMDMSKIYLPQVSIHAPSLNRTYPLDNQQINPSSIWSYLGIRGCGTDATEGMVYSGTMRDFNAIPFLAYWDIYKNYYANKQEEEGAVIHKPAEIPQPTLEQCLHVRTIPEGNIPILIPPYTPPTAYAPIIMTGLSSLYITGQNFSQDMDFSDMLFYVRDPQDVNQIDLMVRGTDLFANWGVNPATSEIVANNPKPFALNLEWGGVYYDFANATYNQDTEPQITRFPLSNIDDMRLSILRWANDAPFIIDQSAPAPYGLPLKANATFTKFSQLSNQEGLALKTYQSDLFNNWISTEWIDGPDGISEITKIDTSGGAFTIDELNLKNKIYNMLNRIAISGGTYDDWLDAVYTEERQRPAENPMYMGGLIRNLVFQEVVSNAQTNINNENKPLGSLAGRGKMGDRKVGGKIIIKVDEPSYIMGIVSLTPYVDYSQGNKWDTNLKTMNDLHKPAMDEIGFQDLITDQMAWYDTTLNRTPHTSNYRSAGKQPAWINYMTNVNVVKGNFAIQSQQMYMVLNRRYSAEFTDNGGKIYPKISDLTTYIDPSKFNHIFADTRRDAQNFWMQIGVNMEARRKMSAKVIPNL